MIEVKIARNLTRDGVDGLRWVLLDPPEAAAAAAAAAPEPLAGGAVSGAGAGSTASPSRAQPMGGMADAHRTRPRQALMLGGLKTLVVVLALGAAVATAWRVIGPPRLPGERAALPGAHPKARAGARPETLPGALPASQAQPAASAPTLTAGLRTGPDPVAHAEVVW